MIDKSIQVFMNLDHRFIKAISFVFFAKNSDIIEPYII